MKESRNADSRWVNQTITDVTEGPISGDCTEACLAGLFDIDLREVPELYTLSGDSYRYWTALRDFVESRGFAITRKEPKYLHKGLYLQSGMSYLGTRHMVIMRNGEMLHDPHPSRAGLLYPETNWILLPLDPGKLKLIS